MKYKHTFLSNSCFVEDSLVALGCFVLFDSVVVFLTHSPFPFSILSISILPIKELCYQTENLYCKHMINTYDGKNYTKW